jgi:ribosomal protein S16
VDHHISNFRFQNINEVTVAVGDQVEAYEYLKDAYSDDKLLNVTKSQDQIGTGGDLISYARTLRGDRDIIIQNVDTILNIDLDALSNDFRVAAKMGAVACIALTTNRGVPNEGAFAVSANSMVMFSDEFSNEPTPDTLDSVHYRASSTGAVAITAHFLRSQKWDKSHGQNSLYKDLLHDAWSQGKLSAYNNRDGFFRDVGSYNPHTKESNIQAEVAQKYLDTGAQPTPRVAKLLKEAGVKLPKWVKEPVSDKQKSLRNPEKLRKNQPKEEAVEETTEATEE